MIPRRMLFLLFSAVDDAYVSLTTGFCSGLSAEIVHFRTPGDNVKDWSGRIDWYIKGSQ